MMAAATFASCTGATGTDPGATGSAGASTSPPAATATGSVQPPVSLPHSAVGRQARWVLDQLALETGPTAAEARRRFGTRFLDEVPPAEVNTVFDELRPAGPWSPVDVDAVGGDAVVRLHDGSGEPWRMVISLGGDGTIATLLIRPDSGDDETANSWAEVHEQLTALDADVNLLAARVTDDGRCEPVTEIEPREPQPMASIFKLYVLDAVAAAVENGGIGWSDQLAVTDEVRSLPSGRLQDRPDGAQVSVSKAAAGMIAISDNTAADMLADLVGRDAVEAAMADLGHADPALNQPFLTTRELFAVGWGPGERRSRWSEADEAERRRLLASLTSGALDVAAGDVDDPAWPSGVSWLGSAHDICAALVGLHERDRSDPDTRMLRTILGHNRGVTIDENRWPYVAYKGGSAPGVVTGSWYGERSDGERYVYVMQAASTDAAALQDHSAFFSLAEDAFTLLARE
ncbi:serine hydrolase [Haloactinopolyspora alba]|nr:serine hydrolase [Haloactinopolyspora alba]